MSDEGQFDNVLAHFRVVSRRGDRAEVICPAHADRQASLSISRGADQPVVMHCHAGCTADAVLAAVGLSMAALGGDTPHVTDTYVYTDADGRELYAVERWVPKTFRPRRGDGTYGRPRPAEEVLYRLPEVLAAKANGSTVYLVEGERDADTARELMGLTATTAMSGASQPWLPQFSEALAGCDVVIVADDDAPGRTRARHLVTELATYARSVRAVLPRVGKDLSDHLWAGYKPDLLDPLPAEGQLARYSLTHVASAPMSWAWEGYLPAGMLSLVEGDPGQGKSVLTVDLAARWTTGAPLPDGSPNPFGGPVRVGMVSAEDDPARVVKPRLMVAGGDPDRLVWIAGMPMVGTRYHRNLDLEGDVEALREAIEAEHLRVLVLDPLMAFLGNTRTAIDAEVRKVLTPLRFLAEETDCAIICVRHLRKAGGKAVHAGGGSIAFTGQARSVLLVGSDPRDDGLRVVAVSKINVAEAKPSQAYRIVPDALGFILAPRLAWEGETDVTAEQLLTLSAVNGSVRAEVAAEVVRLLSIEALDFPALRRRLMANGVEHSEDMLREVLKSVALVVRSGQGTGAYKVVYRLRSADTDAVEPVPDALRVDADEPSPDPDIPVNPQVDGGPSLLPITPIDLRVDGYVGIEGAQTPVEAGDAPVDGPDPSPEPDTSVNPQVDGDDGDQGGTPNESRVDRYVRPGEDPDAALACVSCGSTVNLAYFADEPAWRCYSHPPEWFK